MNNNSKVLALKYRPQTFDDLIGQEVVAETITNSIKVDKIPNALRFLIRYCEDLLLANPSRSSSLFSRLFLPIVHLKFIN